MRSAERSRAALRLLALLLAVTAAGSVPTTARAAEGGGGRPGMDLTQILGGSPDAGFRRALHPGPFRFPEDHGAHPAFRSEWWYLTAHVRDPRGRRWGLQFTLFRQALAPPAPADGPAGAVAGAPASAWRTRTVWMAHVALTDPVHGHQASERIARGALGIAGVRTTPFRAWLDDWSLSGAQDGLRPLHLQARVTDVAVPFRLDLSFDGDRPPVPQGDDGLSRKGGRPGNASRYYSLTRLTADGSIEIDGETWTVQGLGWLDREWSTSSLEPGQVGWDWFALHLDDGRDLMLYRIRRADGSVDPFSAGLLVEPDGSRTRLGPADWTLVPARYWTDETGARWPVDWHLTLPAAGIDGVVRARVDDQLDRLSVRYWEGLVCLDGARSGCGYLELTGYGGAPAEK